jgi:hypothetical protein
VLLNVNHAPHDASKVDWVVQGHQGIQGTKCVPLQRDEYTDDRIQQNLHCNRRNRNMVRLNSSVGFHRYLLHHEYIIEYTVKGTDSQQEQCGCGTTAYRG